MGAKIGKKELFLFLDFFEKSLAGKNFMCIFAKSRYNDSLWKTKYYITARQKSSKSQF